MLKIQQILDVDWWSSLQGLQSRDPNKLTCKERNTLNKSEQNVIFLTVFHIL